MSAIPPDPKDEFLLFISTYKDSKGNTVYLKKINEMISYRKKSLYVDYNDLILFDMTFATLFIQKTNDLLPLLNNALYEYITSLDPSFAEDVDKVFVRIYNLPRTVTLRAIRSALANKLIAVEGIVTKMSDVKQRLVKGTFKHLDPNCNQEFVYPDQDTFGELIETPTVCPVCGKTGRFKLVPEKSTFVDYQRIIIQEKPEDTPSGQMPRKLEVVLEEDLVDTVRPGDRVKIVGMIEVKQEALIKRGASSVFSFQMKAHSVEVSQRVLEEVNISEDEELKIKQLAKDPWIIDRIIASIAPEIYGRWEIKEAIALSLFGGVPKTMPDGTRLRGDIHTLIIGDPGTAKSQILQFAAKVAPRAVYTTGKGSTAVGLTAAVNRDKETGDWMLEAGALVLADGGVAVIDEIEKMRDEDRVAIHEAMEQQTVSIAKAGIVAKLNSRATVISAGNPKFGRYIVERGVADNINLPPSLLSRFDLIFILIDKPGEEDDKMADHILDAHAGNISDKNIIEIDLLKKYIAYARKNVNPKITPEAKKILKEFFIDMRKKGGESPESPVIITPRQLEALIRLSEAYARMRLSDTVSKEDAERAINIMRIFLQTVGIDVETGKMDIDTIMTGKPSSIREKMERLIDIVRVLAGDTSCARLKEIVKEAKNIGIEENETRRLIEQMRRDFLIVETKEDCYRPA